MLRSERHEKILQRVSASGFVSVAELCSMLNVSKATIRRDIMDLEEQQMLKKAYGGAVSKEKPTYRDLPNNVRVCMNRREKELIADEAVRFINEGETVFLDSGTTIFQLAARLNAFSHLFILTNDLHIALQVAANTENKVIVIGGELDKYSSNCTGILTLEMMQGMNINKAFIGTDAVDMKSGLMCYNMNEVAIKQCTIKKSRKNIVLCDSSKFSNSAFMTFAGFDRIDCIITDSGIDPTVVKGLGDMNIELRIASEE